MTIIYINNKKIKVYGHSGYAEIGKDIVCAAISTLVQSLYRFLIVTNNQVEYIDDDGLFEIELIELNENGINIIKEFISIVKELEEQYPQNIYLKYDDKTIFKL